jgi:hypothetical protein
MTQVLFHSFMKWPLYTRKLHAGFLVIHSDNNCQGFKIENLDPGNRKGVEISALFLIAEKWEQEFSPQDIVS